MTKAKYKKTHSDLRRIIHQECLQSGRFIRLGRGRLVQIWHTGMTNIIAEWIVGDYDGKQVALVHYRPRSIYAEAIIHLLRRQYDGVIALPQSPHDISYPAGGGMSNAFKESLTHRELRHERVNANLSLARKLGVKRLNDPYLKRRVLTPMDERVQSALNNDTFQQAVSQWITVPTVNRGDF
jgi:hypothetical protein